MSGLPWYKRDPNAFIEGCTAGNLTLEEVGAYTLLIDEMYRSGRPLVDNPRHGCAYLRCDPRVWLRIRGALIRKGKIYATAGGYLSNLRVEQELRAQYELRETRARAARQSKGKTDYTHVTEAELRCNSTVTEGQLSPSFGDKSLIANDATRANAEHLSGRYRVREEREEIVGIAIPTPAIPEPTSLDAEVQGALKEYDLAAIRAGWVRVKDLKKLSTARRRLVRARLKDGGMAAWMEQIAEAEAQPFLAGDNDRGWRMDLEFFASERGRERIMDGKYRRAPKPGAFDAVTAIRIWREHKFRHPLLTDDIIAAHGATP